MIHRAYQNCRIDISLHVDKHILTITSKVQNEKTRKLEHLIVDINHELYAI